MTVENFTTYTEEDPNTLITKTATRVTWTALTKNEDAYVYKDKTANYFDGNFIHHFAIRATGYGSDSATVNVCNYWALANLVDDWAGIDTANGDALSLLARVDSGNGDQYIQLAELDGGTAYTSASAYEITVNTTYYIKIVRDEAVGTYGTIYCYTYSDSARTTLVNTQSVTLHSSKKDYRYIYALQSLNPPQATYTHSGYTENLELDILTAPTVTTQAVTAISGTTATGNGNLTATGTPTPTQHGHCWNTTGTPTTSDSKTTNGAKTTTGAFTSAMTSLTAGTKYYVRAYATNVSGTVYGNQVEFTASKGTVFPDATVDALRRVSGVRRTFWSGLGGQAVYQMELALGGLTTSYVSPMGSREIPSAAPPSTPPVVTPPPDIYSTMGRVPGAPTPKPIREVEPVIPPPPPSTPTVSTPPSGIYSIMGMNPVIAPNQCPYCGAAFATQTELVAHLRQAHGGL